jgi:aminomethyltransferase
VLLNDEGGILDDLMFVNRGDDLFVVVNGACKVADIAHLQQRIGTLCTITPLPDQALLALQGPQAVTALQRLCPTVDRLVFMTGGGFEVDCTLGGSSRQVPCFITRSGYTGEDGFEISVHQDDAAALARALLAQPEVRPAGLGARDSLRLEAGLCLYGSDIDTTTTPSEAALNWVIGQRRRAEGGFPGAAKIQGEIKNGAGKKRVGIKPLGKAPARGHTEIQDGQGNRIGEITSGGFGPSFNGPVAMGYVDSKFAKVGTPLALIVRGQPLPAEVAALPFVPHRYFK